MEFELADWMFTRSQLSRSEVDFLMEAFAAFGYEAGLDPPFSNTADMHNHIDAIPLGDAPWQCIKARYSGPLPEDAPPWMNEEYEIWCRDPRTIARIMLNNADFKSEFHTAPHREYTPQGERQYTDLMSGNWAWRQAVSISLLSLLRY